MATTFEVNIDVNSASLNELNKEFERLNTLARDLPRNSKGLDQVAASAQKVGTAIEKTNNKLSGLKVDEKAELAVKAFRGLLGGVQAVSAAFIAFGADASAIEGAEKKLLGVFNVVQGLGDLAEGTVAVTKLLGISFAQTGVAAEGAAVGVNSFKTALISSGIGALVVLLGTAVALLLDFGDAEEEVKKQTEELNKAFDEQIAYQDKLLRYSQEQANEDVNNAKIRGASAKEIFEIQEKQLKKEKKLREDNLERLRIDRKKQVDLTFASEEDKNKAYEIYKKKKENINLELSKNEQILYDKVSKIEDNYLKNYNTFTNDLISAREALSNLRTQFALDEQEKQQQILDNEIAAINENNAAKRQLAEELATSEKQAAQIRFTNIKAENAEQLAEELKAENLSGTAKANIRAKYRNLDKLAETQYQKEIAAITYDAQLKNAENVLDTVKETSNRIISELDFYYDNVFSQYNELESKDIPTIFFGKITKDLEIQRKILADTTEEGMRLKDLAATVFAQDFFTGLVKTYSDISVKQKEFLKTGIEGILEEAEFFKKQNKEKTETTVVELQKQELAEVDFYNNQITLAQERAKTDAEFAKQLPALEKQLIRQRENVFDQYQARKKQVIEKGAQTEVQIETNKTNKLEALDKQLLQISRNIEDLKLTQIEDTQKREEAILRASYERLLIDAEGNEELKLALAEEYLVKIALLRKKFREEEETEFQAAAIKIFDLQQQFFNQLSALESTKAQNDLDRELYALNKRTEARIKAAGDDAEAVERIQKDSIETEDSLRKGAFENEKLRKLALARINTAAAVLSILAETPKGDFGIATALLIAGAVATGELQAAAIRDTTYIPTFAQGGLVTGPGTSTSDSILARLSSGEFVVNAKSTQRFLPVLNTLNNTPNNNQLNQTIDSSGSSPMFRTYVLAGDVTSAQAAEARLNQKRKL